MLFPNFVETKLRNQILCTIWNVMYADLLLTDGGSLIAHIKRV